MSLYSSQDIEFDFDGDIVISSKGDVNLASSIDTYKSAANFVLRTDYGDYAPDPSVGCNLGSFIGKTVSVDNIQKIEHNITRTLKERIFNQSDIECTVVPFDVNEVLCVISIRGSYLLSGTITSIEGERIAYTFPFIDGSFLTPITID